MSDGYGHTRCLSSLACCSPVQCIDDLETLYSNNVFLWGGLKESAMYNQDWLFCWCLQAYTPRLKAWAGPCG